MKTIIKILILIVISIGLIGCKIGGQPVIWTKSGQIDHTKGSRIELTSSVTIPTGELAFMKNDIEQKVKEVLKGTDISKNGYTIKINITKYDEGNACARFMLIGLGQMYLYGDVEVKEGDPPVIVRKGTFKKNYCLGGIVGGLAKMRKDMTSKLGKAIAEALKK